jgi:Mg2+ and Co2+ transporter CorA
MAAAQWIDLLYAFSWALTVVASILQLLYFRRKGWIGG